MIGHAFLPLLACGVLLGQEAECSYTALPDRAIGEPEYSIERTFGWFEFRSVEFADGHFSAILSNRTDSDWRNARFTITTYHGGRTREADIRVPVLPVSSSGRIQCPFGPTAQIDAYTIEHFGGFRNVDQAEARKLQPLLSEAARKARDAARQADEAAKKAEASRLEKRRAFLAAQPKLDAGTEGVPVAADKKCLQQTVEAVAMEGLEKRKRLAELVSFGCIFLVPRGTPVSASDRGEGDPQQVTMLTGQYAGRSGWVLGAWVRYPNRAPNARTDKKII